MAQSIVNDNIRKFRVVLGLTLAEFGVEIGATTDRLSKIETGKLSASAELVEKIAAAYKINPGRLYDADFPN